MTINYKELTSFVYSNLSWGPLSRNPNMCSIIEHISVHFFEL